MTSAADTIFMSVHLTAAATLDAINASVKLYEETIGPLVMMKTDNDTTLLKFDALSPAPTPVAKVAKQVDGKPKVPDGATLVTAGQIFVEGAPALCAATRG